MSILGIPEVTVALVTVVTTLVFLYVKFAFSYWKRHGFYYVPGKFPFGNIGDFVMSKKSIGEVYVDLYEESKDHKYVGCYTFLTPTLMIKDLDMVKNVLMKEFSNFSDRGAHYNVNIDTMSANLFMVDGEDWKPLRNKLSPIFTSGKIKFMFKTMKICTDELVDYLLKETEHSDVLDFKKMNASHSLNIIAKVAMGLEGHDPWSDSEFRRIAFKATDPTNTVQTFRIVIPQLAKSLARLLRLRFAPKEVEEYFLDITRQLIEHRETSKTTRNDFIQLLIEVKNKHGVVDYDDTINKEYAAQMFMFVMAAYETFASTMSFCLYELAKNQEIQEKLISEIDSVDSDVSYETLNELPYLSMVLEETWRKHPPATFYIREAKSDYKLPDGLVIPAGVKIIIPTLALQRDPKYFPDPTKFDPERFNKESPTHPILPFSNIPFGDGPRICIGMRYAKIQSKLTVFSILSQFRLELSEKTSDPPCIEPKTFVYNPKGGMWLRLVNRK